MGSEAEAIDYLRAIGWRFDGQQAQQQLASAIHSEKVHIAMGVVPEPEGPDLSRPETWPPELSRRIEEAKRKLKGD